MSNRFHISKSQYMNHWYCPKRVWLQLYMERKADCSPETRVRFETGKEVGELAKPLFGPYVDVTTKNEDGTLNFRRMINATKREIEKGTNVICEASFSFDGLFCAVDILKRDTKTDAWAIYEVKSSTSADKYQYVVDASYQLYVLRKCGLKISGVYIVTLNRNYLYEGVMLDINELFKINDITADAEQEYKYVPDELEEAAKTLCSTKMPDIPIGEECNDPYECPFWDYCSGGQKYSTLFGPEYPERIDRNAIEGFLYFFNYPLYFFDLETVQPVIPRYPFSHCYDQIPFQYSVHYLEREGGKLGHKEFLAEPGTDPRRAFAEHVVADIPTDACVVVYNKSFECTRLRELAMLFPDLADHLKQIADNIIDLMIPFKQRWYYLESMHGSYSIKAVLPALFPDDPELNYANLDGIHNGSEAMEAFPAMEKMTKAKQEKTRAQLLKYCELDTYAMVKIWEKLRQTQQHS